MTLTLKQAGAKALADLQLIPGWEHMDETLQEVDPFGDRVTMALAAADREIPSRTERPFRFMEAEVSQPGERNVVMMRVLLYLLNDMKVPAAIWPRQDGDRIFDELVVY